MAIDAFSFALSWLLLFYIYAMGNSFKMSRVYAYTIVANMMNIVRVWNSADK